MSAFNGQSLAGTWRLFVSDNAGSDTGQVDEWCLLPTFSGGADSDGDGVPDSSDNCTDVANPGQTDSNGDGIGNACDADINNDCIVDVTDLAIFRTSFLTSPGDTNWNPDTDMDDSLAIDVSDLAIVRLQFLLPPGPAAAPNALSGCLAP
ncbi:MAG: thrombospondin type 3 repeat-containing protein [Gammaproteobacteria bacterium]|nr:thrombospondin type 3 repeat-containing protein [Gammaproteobacteria bacterium]